MSDSPSSIGDAPADGYVRFHVVWAPASAPEHANLSRLDAVRTRLWDRGWVGATPEGIGFGNLSIRNLGQAASFIITGTATGARRVLGTSGYVRVMSADPARNTVACEGPVKASAETMTHAAVYAAAGKEIRCVIHIHAADLWNRALHLGWPQTPPEAEYGTPALAESVRKLVRTLRGTRAVMVLAGHRDGLLAYGETPEAVEAELQAAANRAH